MQKKTHVWLYKNCWTFWSDFTYIKEDLTVPVRIAGVRAIEGQGQISNQSKLEGPDFQSKQFVTNQLSLQDNLIEFTTIYLLDYSQCISNHGVPKS